MQGTPSSPDDSPRVKTLRIVGFKVPEQSSSVSPTSVLSARTDSISNLQQPSPLSLALEKPFPRLSIHTGKHKKGKAAALLKKSKSYADFHRPLQPMGNTPVDEILARESSLPDIVTPMSSRASVCSEPVDIPARMMSRIRTCPTDLSKLVSSSSSEDGEQDLAGTLPSTTRTVVDGGDEPVEVVQLQQQFERVLVPCQE